MGLYTDLDCRMIDASILAYEFTSNGPLDKSLSGYGKVGFDPHAPAPVGIIRGFEKINAAFVGRLDTGDLVVAFRGTIPPGDGPWERWISDWLNDFRIGQTRWSTTRHPDYGYVEAGFAAATLDLWPQVKVLVDGFMRAGPPPRSIVVTGHSKGAALAPLAATLLRAAYPTAYIQLRVFAQPLTGNQTFKDKFTLDGLNGRMVRFQYDYDLVPFLPEYWSWRLAADCAAQAADSLPEAIHASESALSWAYVDIGSLIYIKDDCTPLVGEHGYVEARNAIERALLELRFSTIMHAHSARGGYAHCTCPPHQPPTG